MDAPVDFLAPGTVNLGFAGADKAGLDATLALASSAESAARAATSAGWTALPPTRETTAAAVPAGRPGNWNGWISGASGVEAEDGSFATFRGKPLGVVAVWSDTTVEAQTNMDSVDNYADFDGQMDIAVGGLVRGETWAQAAAGAFVGRWTTAISNIKAKRAGKGTTFIRIGHEFNGDWMPWGVNAANLADYKKGYRLYAGIVRKEFPDAKLTWSPNGGNHNTLTMEQMWPGDDVVDVIGPDDYDGYPAYTDASTWNEIVNSWSNPGTPRGIGAWQKYAARHGKPLALPEWGMQGGDHPVYIQGVHDVLAKFAAGRGGSAAGRVIYDCYFNAEDKFKLTDGDYPQAAAVYALVSLLDARLRKEAP